MSMTVGSSGKYVLCGDGAPGFESAVSQIRNSGIIETGKYSYFEEAEMNS
jgi:hypothetical protein